MSTLIGLYSSVMGSGKTELTNVLWNEFGYAQVKFAGTLKEMIRHLLINAGMTSAEAFQHTDGDLKETVIPFFGVSARHMMQTLGTDWGRKMVKPTIWIDVAKARIAKLLRDGWRVVVDDMRFPNEFEAIKDLGGVTCRVIRPGLKDTTGHVSEGLLDGHPFDYALPNVGGLEEWRESARIFHRVLSAPAGQVVEITGRVLLGK